jgi:ribosomal protein L1
MSKKHSKRYREVSQKIELNKKYSLAEALNFLQENNKEKSKNIEMAVSLH